MCVHGDGVSVTNCLSPTDCSMKFNSEGEYNVHLNSHINYGYKCPHHGCELSFPCKKRLAFHTRVVHNATPTTDSGELITSSLHRCLLREILQLF